MLDAKIASALNRIIQNSHFKKKVSLEEQKAQKEGPFALMIQYWIMLIYSLLLFMTIIFRNSTQDGDEVLLSMSKIPSDDILESLYKLRIRESAQLKTRIVRHGDSSEDIEWKEKSQCSKGNQCSFWHESNDRARKPTPNAATLSEPSMTRSRGVSRKRSITGKSNHGDILRQPCRHYLKRICTRSPCEYWHPPECQFYNNRIGLQSRR